MSALAVAARRTAGDTEDIDLVQAVRAGDDRAFELLYERYHRRIEGFVLGRVRDRGWAEDVTQEVFIAALRRMRETDRDIAFKPWVYEIAKNACIDAHRRSQRSTQEVPFEGQDEPEAGDPDWLADGAPAPDIVMETKQALDDLRGAFGSLSQTHHDILVMREFEGRSYREISERLGMSRPSVESTLFRARRRLTDEYEELVSGKRCLRVQSIIATAGGRALGSRDHRRMARHISHCQPCRRHAILAGVDPTAARSVAARVAGLLPLPAFLRRRWEDHGDRVLTPHAGPVAQWSANVAGTLDPGAVAGWSKAIAAAVAVAVAGVGAGAALTNRGAIDDLIPRPPIVSALQAQSSDDATSSHSAPAGSVHPGAAETPLAIPRQDPTGAGHRVDRPGAPSPEDKSGQPRGAGENAPTPARRGSSLGSVTDRLGIGGSPSTGETTSTAGADDVAAVDGDRERGRLGKLLDRALGGGRSADADADAGAGTGQTADMGTAATTEDQDAAGAVRTVVGTVTGTVTDATGVAPAQAVTTASSTVNETVNALSSALTGG